MKKPPRPFTQGFTLVELLVVVAIIAIMLGLGANMIRNSGRGQGLSDATQTVYDMAREARLEAISKSTWSRLVVVSDPGDTSPNSRNLRYLAIMVKRPVQMNRNADPDSGEWEIKEGGRYLPAGFYVSPKYSTLVESPTYSDTAYLARSNSFAQLLDKMRMGNRNQPLKNVYFIEFDPQGRMTEPTMPTRLLVIGAMIDPGVGGDDAGIRPNPVDDKNLPALAGGIVIWPKGNISMIRSREQMFPGH